MLTPYKPHFVEQIFTDQTGQQFRLVFLVSLGEDGRLKGQLVSAKPLSSHVHSDATPICLPFVCPKNDTVTEYFFPLTSVVSPFSSTEFLITSQPTRAPSL